MHSFHYSGNELYCESVPLPAVAEAYGTPLYVYSAATIVDHYRRLDRALQPLHHEICYAVKANSNLTVIKLLADEGSGFDIVSGGELYRVIKAGGDPGRCTFAGVGKTREEIEFALHAGIYCFNVESESELENIDRIAREVGRVAPVAVRINPNVDAQTHRYISTGKKENKFGIDAELVHGIYEKSARLANVQLRGVQTHIGSQIMSAAPFSAAVERLAPLVAKLQSDFGIEFFSIGGGIGIVYHGSLESGNEIWWKQDQPEHALTIDEYASAVVPALRSLPVKILLEPGRFLVGNAGVLLSRVLYVKTTPTKRFVIVDAGMNDLLRPALYQGYHEIVPLLRPPGQSIGKADVVGPVCESGDFFALDREITEMPEGSLVALMSAGAYGFSMASNYNSRPLPAEVMVSGNEHRLIRRRQNLADLIDAEVEDPGSD